jgi:drug/metabolite transporter (DMT)-like permease
MDRLIGLALLGGLWASIWLLLGFAPEGNSPLPAQFYAFLCAGPLLVAARAYVTSRRRGTSKGDSSEAAAAVFVGALFAGPLIFVLLLAAIGVLA